MIILFGWRVRASVIARGVFMCPHCGADRNFLHKRLRRWFTLFFVPLIPLNTGGEFVQCDTCKQAFKPSVLTTPTTATLQNELLWAIREAITTMLRVARTPGADEAAIAVLSSYTDRRWTNEELAGDVEHLNTMHLDARLGVLAGVMNEQGKERFVSACADVVATGGVIDGDSRAAVERIAAGLLMTPAHARGIIEQTLETARG